MLTPAQFPLQIVKLVPKPFDGNDWFFEIKHDGFRMVAIRDGASTRLFTRNGRDITRGHRRLVEELERLGEALSLPLDSGWLGLQTKWFRRVSEESIPKSGGV